MGAVDAADDPLLEEVLLGKLRVLRRIGAGGMGAVYEVEHLLTRHRRALKILHPRLGTDSNAVERFLREASVAGTVKSPFVVDTYDAGTLDDGSVYVLMELLEGRSLGDELRDHGPMSSSRVVSLMHCACEGLGAAHAAGIIHRDLKPENLFVTWDQSGDESLKVIDFGVSKFNERHITPSTLTADGAMIGTPVYMSPEQLDGGKNVDERSDVYALGLVMYEALSGRRAYEASDLFQLVAKIARGDYTPLDALVPGIEPAVMSVVDRAMHRHVAARYPTVRSLQADLQAIRTALGQDVAFATTYPDTSQPPAPPPRPRRRAAIAFGLGFALVAGVAWLVLARSDTASSVANVPTRSPVPEAGEATVGAAAVTAGARGDNDSTAPAGASPADDSAAPAGTSPVDDSAAPASAERARSGTARPAAPLGANTAKPSGPSARRAPSSPNPGSSGGGQALDDTGAKSGAPRAADDGAAPTRAEEAGLETSNPYAR